MGEGSTYSCARCGEPCGMYGHFRGEFDGTRDEWACKIEDVERHYTMLEKARANRVPSFSSDPCPRCGTLGWLVGGACAWCSSG